MPAQIVRLRTRADRIRQADGDHLRQTVLDYAAGRHISDRAIGEIVATIDRETASARGWTFVMISAEMNNSVVEWLFANADRPMIAVRLWSRLFIHLRFDTGEIVASRDELAAAVGTSAREVSRIMSQLETTGAISKQREGRGVRYFLNPKVGTHLTGAARSKSQAKAPKLALVP